MKDRFKELSTQCMKELTEVLADKVTVFMGQTGAGKTTLLNLIAPGMNLATGETSDKLGRGRHTTRHVEFFEVASGLIADTPGFSTFDISEIPSQELENYFVEFEREKEKCEFIGCTHIKEKNCGVKQAIEEGKISKERYNRFCKIYEELKQKEERKKW